MVKTLFEHVFKNGNRVEVTDKGVTIWDNVERRWVIDASALEEDSRIRIANEIKKINEMDEYHLTFKSTYPRKRKPKK